MEAKLPLEWTSKICRIGKPIQKAEKVSLNRLTGVQMSEHHRYLLKTCEDSQEDEHEDSPRFDILMVWE